MAPRAGAADRLDAVIANVPGAIYRCRLDADWTMELISDEIERLSGYPAADFVGSRRRSFASIIHPDDRDHVGAAVAQAVAEDRPFAPEYRIVRSDGTTVWVLERGRASRASADGEPWLDGVLFDITERKVLEEELRRALADEAAAQERLRIAHDLHDAVGHALSIGAIQAGGARAVLFQDPTAAADAIQAVEDSLRSALREMRAMVSELHSDPRRSDDGRLRLDDLVGSARRAGLVVEVRTTGVARPLPAAVEVSLYRTVQECLTNCAKHAAGSAVTVDVAYEPRRVVLAVTDDGTGCAATTTGEDSGGQGLEGIRQRAAALGGSSEAGALPGGGFRVVVCYPA